MSSDHEDTGRSDIVEGLLDSSTGEGKACQRSIQRNIRAVRGTMKFVGNENMYGFALARDVGLSVLRN